MDIELRNLQKKDLKIVKEIYDYYILNSTATFHINEISLQELEETIYVNHSRYKSYLIVDNGEICGYCYLGPYKKRPAYNRTAEVTIYLKPGYTGKGTGKQVLNKLLVVAKENSIKVLIGVISADNEKSIRLFENCGFEKCAHFKEVGEKFDQILDVVAYQKIL